MEVHSLVLTHVLRTYTQLWAPVRMSFAIQTHRALVKMEAELEAVEHQEHEQSGKKKETMVDKRKRRS